MPVFGDIKSTMSIRKIGRAKKKKQKRHKTKMPRESNLYKVRFEIEEDGEIRCPAFTAPLMDFDFMQIEAMDDEFKQ